MSSDNVPGSPIASASRRVKKLPKNIESKENNKKEPSTERLKKLDLKAPKKLDFRRHSLAASSTLLGKKSAVLFSPTYHAGAQEAPGLPRQSSMRKNIRTKQRAKSVFVTSPGAKTKSLSQYRTSTNTTQGLGLLSFLPISDSPENSPKDKDKKDDPKTKEDEKTDDKTDDKTTKKESEDDKKEQSSKQEVEDQNQVQGGGEEDNGDYYGDEEYTDDDEGDFYEEFDPFIFIKQLGPLPIEMKQRKSPLPEKKKGSPLITLALDLDETLVHCSVSPIDGADLTFPVEFNGVEYTVFVRLRPHLTQFLETVSQWFECVLFTASQQVYADSLMDIIDEGRKYIPYRIFRDSCVCTEGNYLKDLHILGRDLRHTAIVDNSVQAFGYQLNNGIPIESWFDDPDDKELLNMLEFLKDLKDVKDVRPLIRDTFRIEEFVNSL